MPMSKTKLLLAFIKASEERLELKVSIPRKFRNLFIFFVWSAEMVSEAGNVRWYQAQGILPS